MPTLLTASAAPLVSHVTFLDPYFSDKNSFHSSPIRGISFSKFILIPILDKSSGKIPNLLSSFISLIPNLAKSSTEFTPNLAKSSAEVTPILVKSSTD
ncbi:hypothetical protein NRP93_001128 [Clostridium botulinum]|nr:hypothetical protein [Clostridium botulinum]